MVMPAVISEGMREGMSEVLTESMSEGVEVSQHRERGVSGVVEGASKGRCWRCCRRGVEGNIGACIGVGISRSMSR
jgi:hypothetical protein